MGRKVIKTEIGFHLDNAAGGGAMHDDLPQASARHFHRASGVERARQDVTVVQDVSERNRVAYVRMLSNTMRLFTGLDLPAHVAAAIEKLLETLRPMARLRWTPVENLHVTTKFIGEWPEARLEEMKAALSDVPGRASISVAIRGLELKPRLFWAKVHAPALADLARDIDTAAAKLGIAPEQRAFNPHLTLARIGKPVRFDISRVAAADFGSFEADRFFLYLSKPGSGGSVYSKLAEFPFAK